MLDRFRLQFRIRVDATGGRVETGRPAPSFVRAVREIARLHRIERGDIECRGRGRRARLRFTNGFPENGRQAIRNAWQAPTAPGPTPGNRSSG